MANIVPLDAIQLPAHLINRKATNEVFAAGLSQGGGFPVIGLKGTRFVVRADGGETVLPSLEVALVLITAKPNLDKTYYASKFDPNSTDSKSPDCFSKDGAKPDAASPMKQHESCAGCPMNQFGSGTDNQGNPGKGKACHDKKWLAVFANNGVYGFAVPPASLKAFTNYVKETSRRGVDLSTAITVISFDANYSFPVLTFNFGGFLGADQVAKIDAMKTSDAVADIIGGTQTLVSPAVAAAPAPVIEAPNPVVADPFASAVVETADPFAEVIDPAPVVEKPKKAPAAPKKAAAPVTHEPTAEELELMNELGISL